jgi:hypothetical protein
VLAGSGGYILGNLLKLRPPFAHQQVGPVLTHLKQNLKPGERVFITNMALPSWQTYHRAHGLQDAPVIEGELPELSWACALKEIAQVGPGRYWVLLLYNDDIGGPEADRIAPLAGERGLTGRYEIVARSPGAYLATFDLAPMAGRPTSPAPLILCDSDPNDERFSTPARLRARAGD